jgi:hypothetical protein
MSYAVKILTQAESDALEVAFWYDAQMPRLGEEFMAEVEAAAASLVANPITRLRFKAAFANRKWRGVVRARDQRHWNNRALPRNRGYRDREKRSRG